MMRRVQLWTPSAAVAVRSYTYSSNSALTEKNPGYDAGSYSGDTNTSIDLDSYAEMKRPVWRQEVRPHKAEKTYLNTMYRWGYNSLALHLCTNESSGPWWNANNSTLPISRWGEAGENVVANFWCGIQRHTMGIGQMNLQPGKILGETYGNKKSKKGELRVDYQEKEKDEPQRLVMPQLPEHVKHDRKKHPLNGNEVIDAVKGKRVLREIQYSMSRARRFYLIDAVFGSNPKTATPYRVVSDNPVHAYFASFASIRSKIICAEDELTLAKRVGEDPFDEWLWRRPGVTVFSGQSYDFELPRIVEEFGGPRPQDLGLKTNRFTLTDPYSIPMKSIIGAEPSCTHMLDQIALLSGRWGYYADNQQQLTLGADSAFDPKTGSLTVLVGGANNGVSLDGLRSSKYLYGAHYHRLADGSLSRAFDATTFKEASGASAARRYDLVEESLNSTVQRPLSTVMGTDDAKLSSRFAWKSRRTSENGFKLPHNHGVADAKAKAQAGGHLFSAASKSAAAATGTLPRPSSFPVNKVTVVVVDGKNADKGLGKASAEEAAAAIVQGMESANKLYAEAEPLTKTFAEALAKAANVQVVGKSKAAEVADKLGKSGAL